MKYCIRILALITTVIISFEASSQVVNGDVDFQDERDVFNFINVEAIRQRTSCDSLGYFTITLKDYLDTIVVRPFPAYIKVKLYNIPSSMDTITLNSIPLFADVGRSTPMINFKSKRASKKYFKNREKERDQERLALQQKIESYRYIWNQCEYKLELIRTGTSSTILINLKD